jgi:hypothetical protein
MGFVRFEPGVLGGDGLQGRSRRSRPKEAELVRRGALGQEHLALEIVLEDGMRQNNELSFIRVSGNKQRSAFGLASFSTSFNALHPSALAARARRLVSASAKQRRRSPMRWSSLPGHLGRPRLNM